MNTVKKMAPNTLILTILIVGVTALTHYCEQLDTDILPALHHLLNARIVFGPLHFMLMRIGFFSIIVVTCVKAIYLDFNGGYLFRVLVPPLLLTAEAFIGAAIYLETEYDVRWFVLFYYLALILFTRTLFRGLYKINGAGPAEPISFIKSIRKLETEKAGTFDTVFIYTIRGLLLEMHLCLFAGFVWLCIENRQIFPEMIEML